MKDWLKKNIKHIIFLEIRDTREYDVADESSESTLSNMLVDPLFTIQNKWECFQSYKHTYIKDYTPSFLGANLHYVTLAYVPKETGKYAALNFHLTLKEKEDLYESINNKENQQAVKTLVKLLK